MSTNFGGRVVRASGALIQGFVFIPLFTLTGSLISILVGNVWPGIEGGAVTGTYLSLFSSLFLFPCAVAAPVGPAQFLSWFFRSAFLEQCCVGITAALSFFCYQALPQDVAWVSVFVAFSTYATTHIIFGILFDDPVDLGERAVGGSGGLSSFEDVKRRADLFGRIRRGPDPDQGEANWQNGWRLFTRQFKRARGNFYDTP